MKRKSSFFGMVAIVALSFMTTPTEAAGPLRQGLFARALNVGPLRHAPGYRGAEVVFRTSGGRATKEQAMAHWATSPAHAAAINSGSISRVVCRGRTCVGR
jgi:hypothetical protein